MKSFKYILCKRRQINDLFLFLKKYWGKNHILLKDKKLFDWQYKNNLNKNYNFIVAVSKKNEILGILGFIPLSHFSKKLKFIKRAWLSIWIIKNKISFPGLGIGMINYLEKKIGFKTILNIGLNNRVVPLFKSLKYRTGILDQYLLINDRIKKFSILSNYKNSRLSFRSSGKNFKDYKLSDMSERDFKSLKIKTKKSLFKIEPKKDADYIINRYLKHPRYRYRILSVNKKNKLCSSIIVLRKVSHNNSSILRIVDYQGEIKDLSRLKYSFKKLLYKGNHEYIDFLQSGIPNSILKKSGFVSVYHIKNLVAPNYFEPFVKKIIKINFAYKSEQKKDFFFFKADGDQDRPNVI
jgi:predicted nucleic acid-binding Zn finger protein